MTDLLVARVALQDAVRPRRLLTALLLVLLPAAIGLIWHALTAAADWSPEDTYDHLSVAFVFGFTLTILSVVYGTGVVSQEVEQRTIVYVLTRPLARWRLLLAKFAVSVIVVAVVSIVANLLLALVVFGPAHFADAGVGPDVRALAVGAVAYGCLFLLLGAMLPRPLIWGLLFVFFWETLVPTLPGSFARISIMSYLRVLALREVTDSDSPPPSSNGNFLLNLSRPPQIDISGHQALLILALVSLVCLAAAVYLFSTREYVPREDAE